MFPDNYIPMSRFFLLLILLVAFAGPSYSQELYVPIEVQKAYARGTRMPDGAPGPHFWQNHARYSIDVAVDPATASLRGEETVVYVNHSPDDLRRLVIRLLYDIYRKGAQRDSDQDPATITDGVILEYLSIDGVEADLSNPRHARRRGTNFLLDLPDPLPPGDSLSLVVKWSQQIPPNDGRIGTCDSTSAFSGYFYPQIAVYDDIDGWDTYPHDGKTEFYNLPADFDVRIRAPRNFAIWATGELVNAAELLPKELRQRYEKAAKANEPVVIIGPEDWKKGLSMLSDTWHFRAKGVPDFAFAYSDHFTWEGISLQTGGRSVRIYTVFPESHREAYEMATVQQRDIMRFFSEDFPGIPYPYPAFTTFNGLRGGGMEFPMMANNGAPRSERGMMGLIAHEMYHMYVPFYLCTNEKKYAWMDEGWASFMDERAVAALLDQPPTLRRQMQTVGALENILGALTNVPLLTLSEYTGPGNYGFNAYSYPEYLYGLLYDQLGEPTFRKCLQEFYRRWNGKGPTPYDFFNTFEEVAGVDLDWFWQPWFAEFGYPDLAIEEVSGSEVHIARHGNKPVPIELTAVYPNGDTVSVFWKMDVWAKTKKVIVPLVYSSSEPPALVYLNSYYPDLHREDNFFLAKPDPRPLDEYAGVYRIGRDGLLKVHAREGFLYLESLQGWNEYWLFPLEGDRFGTAEGAMEVQFKRDANGQIVGYEGTRFNDSISATKEP